VFSYHGERIHSIKTAWALACERAGLADASKKPTKLFHDLRRTAVRNLVRSGNPEKVAMQISGHRTRSVFDRYDIVTEDDIRRAARKQHEYVTSIRKLETQGTPARKN
jgi:hypothetical protein